ncbi:MAG: TlpA family protein disulfide reductase [Bdellovibrionales bacterium]|nr:TlpA family protein disulfide reductase [Bdellovibrionales bacterium]NQZ19809.1 TlpA family protein disulfide reductase [Bdellovibrionales bacterium]
MKVLGLVIVLSLSIFAGVIYWQSNEWESQKVPDSYKVLDDLENKGLYQGEDLKLKSIEGEEIAFSSLRGKVVILSFWATWCEPCVDEFPSFIKLLDQFPDKIKLLAISQDNDEKDVRKFIEAFKGYRQNLVVAMDEGKALGKAFGVDRLPEGFVFDQEGRLVKKIIGIQDWASEDALVFFQEL